MAQKYSQKNRGKSSKNKSSKKQQVAVAPGASQKSGKQENGLKRFLIVAICVIVALSLMLPVAGIGVASCSANTEVNQEQSAS